MGKRHLTPAEIKEQCKRIARESRMADRTPWTAMGIICSYVIMRREGFKGQRISRLANKVNEMEADWSAGKIDLKEISQPCITYRSRGGHGTAGGSADTDRRQHHDRLMKSCVGSEIVTQNLS